MIAILSALPDEIDILARGVRVLEEGGSGETRYKFGDIHGRKVVLGSTGVGIKRARAGASIVIERYKPGLIISAGLGGALNSGLRVGDVVLGESVISLKKGERKNLFCELPGNDMACTRGDILTENRFVNDPGLKSRLYGMSGAHIVDMETWGVAEAVLVSATPLMSVRSVSDESWERLPDMGAIYNSAGRLAFGKALPYFLRRPTLVPPYIRFRYGSSKKAVRSLNAFLDSLLRRIDDPAFGHSS